jgi:hypothetical protein
MKHEPSFFPSHHYFFHSGAIVDREVLILLGQETCLLHRGAGAEIPTGMFFSMRTHDWLHS